MRQSWSRCAGRATRSAPCSPSPRSPRCCKGTGVALHVDAVAAEGPAAYGHGRRSRGPAVASRATTSMAPPGSARSTSARGCGWRRSAMGGGQERGLRSGTENLPGIVGMADGGPDRRRGAAHRGAPAGRHARPADREVLATIPDSHLNGHPIERLPNNAHFRFEGIEGESLLLSAAETRASRSPPGRPARRRPWSRPTPSYRADCSTKKPTDRWSSLSDASARTPTSTA